MYWTWKQVNYIQFEYIGFSDKTDIISIPIWAIVSFSWLFYFLCVFRDLYESNGVPQVLSVEMCCGWSRDTSEAKTKKKQEVDVDVRLGRVTQWGGQIVRFNICIYKGDLEGRSRRAELWWKGKERNGEVKRRGGWGGIVAHKWKRRQTRISYMKLIIWSKSCSNGGFSLFIIIFLVYNHFPTQSELSLRMENY